jgi:hypothetical protein
MIDGYGLPDATDVLCGTRTTSGTLVTVPAGRAYTGTLTLSGSIAVAGTSIPVVTINGSGGGPADGTVVGRMNLTGLALTTVYGTAVFEVIARAPAENDLTIDFTPGATGTNSATLNGFVYG